MAQVITQQQMQLLPEYQEKFLKDLLANIYRTEERPVYETDPETGETLLDEEGNPVAKLDAEGNPVMESYAAGIGAISPLYGEPQFDEEGNPLYERDEAGNLILDMNGQPIQQTKGGIPRPDVVGLTDAQQQAIDLATTGVGAYSPMMEAGKETLNKGISALSGGYDPTTGEALAYDPQSYKDYMDPYEDQVVQSTLAEIQRSGDLQKQGLRDQAVRAGAFGGSRALLAEMEQQRNIDDLKARTAGKLRSAGYQSAQDQAQGAFENQMARGQTGAQMFQNLGEAQVGIGQLAQSLQNQDVKSLLGVGGLEQQQQQSEYDVQRQGAIEEMYEPYQRFGFMSDILRGVPTSQSKLTMGSAPEQNVLGDVVGTTMSLNAYGQG